MQPILDVRNLVKHFKKVQAVNGLSLQIPPGICFGLLGPNGAGKTTTIEMMEGLSTPTSGEILYKGRPLDKTFRLEAGIQFQSTALMDFVTVREVLALFASFYPHPADLHQLIEQCSLGEFLDQPAAKLSGGQRQRVLLAVALVNDPQIIFLDEPTTGLDPQARRNFWHLIETIKAQGKTIVLTTHYMDEAQQLCDQLVIVDKGRIIAGGSPQALLHSHFDHAWVCLDRSAISAAQLSALQLGPEDWEERHHQLRLRTSAIEKTIQQCIGAGIDLGSLQVHTPTLDDLFLKLTGHSLRD
jgi:ABC-2 type transport system ATP-binding protein